MSNAQQSMDSRRLTEVVRRFSSKLTTIRAAFTVHSRLTSLIRISTRLRVKAIYESCSNNNNRRQELHVTMQKSEMRTSINSLKPKSSFELAIDELFIDADRNVTAARFDALLQTWLQKSDPSDISMLVQVLAKKSKNNNFLHMKRNLPQIASRLDCLSSLKWDIRKISSILYGLNSHEEVDAGYTEVVSVMSKILGNAASIGAVSGPGDISIILYGLRNCKYLTEASKSIMYSLGLMIKTLKGKVDSQAVGNSLYGLQNMRSDNPEVRSLLSALTPYLLRCEDALSAQEVGNALYGLQGMSSDHEEVGSLLKVLATHVKNSRDRLSPQAIGNALYGLQGMNSNSMEVRNLLQTLLPKVFDCRRTLTAQNIGNALHGFQNMSSDDNSLLSLLSAMTFHVKKCTETLTPQNIGNALYGLRKMSSNKAEVRSILSELVPHIERCAESFKGQEIGNAIYGLRCMTSDSKEVLMMLSSIAAKLEMCTESLKGQEIGNAMYGLQGMSSSQKEVRLMLRALLPHIRKFKGVLTAQEVSNAMYGLKCMSSDHEEVLNVVSALSPHVRECEEALKGKEMGCALLGLRGMNGTHEEVSSLLSVVAPLIFNSKEVLTLGDIANIFIGLRGTLHSDAGSGIVLFIFRKMLGDSNLEVHSSIQFENLGRAIALMGDSFSTMLTPSELKNWEIMLSTLKSEVKVIPDASIPLPTPNAQSSLRNPKQERRLYAAALRALNRSSLCVSKGEFLFDFFECDIVVRIPCNEMCSDDHGYLILDIEVDGVQHLGESKMKSDVERDAYLRSKGVVIHRVNTNHLKGLSDLQVEDFVLDAVAQAIIR